MSPASPHRWRPPERASEQIRQPAAEPARSPGVSIDRQQRAERAPRPRHHLFDALPLGKYRLADEYEDLLTQPEVLGARQPNGKHRHVVVDREVREAFLELADLALIAIVAFGVERDNPAALQAFVHVAVQRGAAPLAVVHRDVASDAPDERPLDASRLQQVRVAEE